MYYPSMPYSKTHSKVSYSCYSFLLLTVLNLIKIRNNFDIIVYLPKNNLNRKGRKESAKDAKVNTLVFRPLRPLR